MPEQNEKLKKDLVGFFSEADPTLKATEPYLNGIIKKYKDPSTLWSAIYKHYYPNKSEEGRNVLVKYKVKGLGEEAEANKTTTTNGSLNSTPSDLHKQVRQDIEQEEEVVEQPELTPGQIASERHAKNLEFKDKLAKGEVDPLSLNFYLSYKSVMDEDLSDEYNRVIKENSEGFNNEMKQLQDQRQTQLKEQLDLMVDNYTAKITEDYKQKVYSGEMAEEEANEAINNDLTKYVNRTQEQMTDQLGKEFSERKTEFEERIKKQIIDLSDEYYKPRFIPEDKLKTHRDKLFEKTLIGAKPVPVGEFTGVVTRKIEETSSPDFVNATYEEKKRMVQAQWKQLKNELVDEWKDDPKQQHKLQTLDDARNEFYYSVLKDIIPGQKVPLSVYAIKSWAQTSMGDVDKEVSKLEKENEKEKVEWEAKMKKYNLRRRDWPAYIFSKVNELDAAKAAIVDIKKILEHPEEDNTFFVNLATGLNDGFGWTSTTPFIATFADMMHNISLYNTVEKHNKGEELSKSEQLLVDAQGYKQAINQESPTPFGYDIGYGITGTMIPFLGEIAVELALTKGGYTLTKNALKKSITEMAENRLKSLLGKRVLGTTVGDAAVETASLLTRSAAMTTINPTMWAEKTLSRMTDQMSIMISDDGSDIISYVDQKGEDFGEAFTKAFGMSATERFTEMLGPHLSGIAGYAKRAAGNTKIGDYLKRSIMAGWMKKKGFSTTSDAVKGIIENRLAWSGILEEYGEEIVGMGLQNMINGEVPWKTTWEDQRDLLISLIIMGTAFAGVSKTAQLIRQEQSIKYETTTPEGEKVERKVKIRGDLLDIAEGLRGKEDFTIDDFRPVYNRMGSLNEEQKFAINFYIFGDRKNLLDKITKELEFETRIKEAPPAEEGITGVIEESVPPIEKAPEEEVAEIEVPKEKAPIEEEIPEITEKERAEIDIFKKPETDFKVKYPDVTVVEGTPEGSIKEWIVPKKVTGIDIAKTEEVVDENPVYQATVTFEDGSQVFKSTDRKQVEDLAGEIKEFKEEIKIKPIEPEPEVEVMSERPEAPKEGEEVFSTDLYTVKKTPFDLNVISKETGKLTSPARKKQIIEQYKEENIDKFIEGKETVIPKAMERVDEVLRFVSEQSENPAEIAISYIQALDIVEENADTKFDYISDNLTKFPMKSFVRFGDKVQLEGKKQIIPNYINNKGVYLDVQAKNMSEESGLDITPQDVIDFVMENPSGDKAYLKTESPLVGSLRDRFRELTGFEIDEAYAKKLSERHTEKKMPKEEEGVTEFFSKRVPTPKKKRKKPTKETRAYKKYKKERVEKGKESGWASLGRPVDKSLNNMLDKADRGEALPEDRKDFKISIRAKKVLEDLGIQVNEKLLSQKYLGVYKLTPKKVRVQALYDVTTVVHEGMHALDDRHGIADKILRNPTDKGLIKSLTDAYVEFYPDAKKSHPVMKRVVEGLSSFVENYLYDPAYVDKNYSALVKTFIKTDGKYNNPEINKLLDDVNSIVEDYAKLESWQKIASRIRDGKEVVKNMKATGFNFFQRVVFQMFDKFEPLRRYAARVGVSETWNDPTIDAFNWMNKNTIIANWIKGKVMVLQKDGNWAKHDINVQKYVKMIKGKEKQFEAYLVSRRVLSDHKKLSDLDALIKSEKDEVKLMDLQEAYDERLKIIKKDDFNLTDASATVNHFEKEFKEATKIHDEIYSHILDFSVNTGILKQDIADQFKQEDGYASFRRYIEDEIDGTVGTYNTKSMSKPSSFKKRTGGRLDVISPIYNQLNSINEILSKGMENILWQKVYKLSERDVEIANRFEEVHYDQKGKPGTMKIFVHGVEKIIKPAPEFVAVAKSLRGREWNLFTKLLRLSSGWFTRATTAANPLFMLGNLPIDQLSALTQTKTGFVPGVDMIKNVPDYMKAVGKEGLFKDYLTLGGRQQTFRAYYSMGPKDVIKEMQGGVSKSERAAYKAKGIVELPLHLLEFPSNTSEYITRYAEFKRSLQRGESESVAMFRAAEITTPFQLEGEWFGGSDYIRSIPYFNATLQVSYKFYRSIKDNHARVATVATSLIVLVIQSTIYIMKYGSDEQKRLLSNIPSKELARALYFPHPNGKDLIRIRIPEWFGAFSGLGALYVIQHYGGNKATMDDYMEAATSPIPDQFNILDPIQIPFAWMPQIMKPITQVITNTRTFPDIAPIVPKYKKDGMPPEEIYSKYSTEVAKSIGELLEVSPTVVDFFIKNQFGTVVSMFAGNVPNNPLYRSEEKYQLAGRAINHFYEAKEEIKEDYNRIRFAEKEAEKMDREPDYDYSEEEVERIKFQRTFYGRVAEMISDMRKVEKVLSLPEEVIEDNYQMILAIDNSEYDKAEELYIRLKNWTDTTLTEITP